MNGKITYVGDPSISGVHHIGVEYDGNYYSVIFGKYVNGGFFSIPNWNCGGELSEFSDVLWNTVSIERSLKQKKVAEVIAESIKYYTSEVISDGK